VPPLAGTVTNNGGTMQTANAVNPQTMNNVHQTMVATNHVNHINRPMTQVIQNQPIQTQQTLVGNQQMQHQTMLQQQQAVTQAQTVPQAQPAPSQMVMVPITITLPSVDSAPRSITIQVPPAAVTGGNYRTHQTRVLNK